MFDSNNDGESDSFETFFRDSYIDQKEREWKEKRSSKNSASYTSGTNNYYDPDDNKSYAPIDPDSANKEIIVNAAITVLSLGSILLSTFANSTITATLIIAIGVGLSISLLKVTKL